MGRFAFPKAVFKVPDTLQDDKFYTVMGLADIRDGILYNIEAYNLSDSYIPEAAVVYSNTSSELIGMVMVDEIYTTATEEGNIESVIKCTTGNTNYEFIIDDVQAFETLKRGDLIELYGFYEQKKAVSYNPLILVDNLPSVDRQNLVIQDVERRDFGEVYYREGDLLVIQNGAVTDEKTGKRELQYVFSVLGDATVQKRSIMYDNTKGREAQIAKVDVSAIKTRYLHGDDASLIYTISRHGEPELIAVYNLK